MQCRILELRYTFQCRPGLLDGAIVPTCDIPAQDSRTLLHLSTQCVSKEPGCMFQCSSRFPNLATFHCRSRLLNYVIRFNAAQTVELCYTIQCGSGPPNSAMHFKCRTGLSNLARLFNSVQESRTLPHVLMQFRTIELCHRFQCTSGLSDFTTRSNAVQDSRMLP